MRAFLITTIIISFSIPGNCQTLKRIPIAKKDSMNGIILKFSDSTNDGYSAINLILKKDSTFSYDRNTCLSNEVSEGKWSMSNNQLILESTFQMGNIPAEISNVQNRIFVDSCNIAVVENAGHKLLTDAFVVVNNDTVKCLPMMGKCNGLFKKIDSVKIVFENGMSSPWITVKNDEQKIALTVLTDISVENYIVMKKQRFKLSGNYLRQQ